MNPWRELNSWLNGITMYRLLAWGLGGLAAVAVLFAFLGVLAFSGLAMLVTLAILITTAYVANKLLATIWEVSTNSESWLITALILFFIVPPANTATRMAMVALVAMIAMASKYVLAFRHKHIFNPAAVAVLITGLAGLLPATWWIGTATMAPFAFILGFLVIRKTRRAELSTTFVAVAVVIMLIVGWFYHGVPADVTLIDAFTVWPLLFFGSIMLTEPSTMPSRLRPQLVFAVIVGVLFAAQSQFGPVTASPELALVVGNLYAFAVSPKYRLRLKLKRVTQLSERVYDFAFEPDRRPDYRPGQYLEVTLPHKGVDGRGNRRTFTIASAPSEPELHLGVKFYEPSSSFKMELRRLKPGEVVAGGQLAGSFSLPQDPAQKLVMVAGGIGVTPFRSMIKHLIDTKQPRDIVLLYAISDPNEMSYAEIIQQAEPLGVRMIPVLGAKDTPASWTGRTGFVDAALIQVEVPDYQERQFYLSGPQIFVDNTRRGLRSLGVRRRDIKTDYFSGY
jgi:ferredoxin-NADP reductase